MQEMGMNFKHPTTVARPQKLRYLVLISSKSKTCLKFMKLGMLSWNGTRHVVVQILSHLGQVWVYASHKPELLTTSMIVLVGNAPTLGTKRYPLPLIALNFFVNIEQLEYCVNFCDFSGFIWTFLCINWVFQAFYSNLNYIHKLQCV